MWGKLCYGFSILGGNLFSTCSHPCPTWWRAGSAGTAGMGMLLGTEGSEGTASHFCRCQSSNPELGTRHLVLFLLMPDFFLVGSAALTAAARSTLYSPWDLPVQPAMGWGNSDKQGTSHKIKLNYRSRCGFETSVSSRKNYR